MREKPAQNCLSGRRKLARVGKTPGPTGESGLFEVDETVVFLDFPGCRCARVAKSERAPWARLIEDYRRSRRQLLGVVIVADAIRGIMEEEERLLDYLAELPWPAMSLASKEDRLSARQGKLSGGSLALAAGLRFSSLTNAGRAAAWERIARWIEAGAGREGEPCQR